MKTINTGFLADDQNKAMISAHELMIGMYVCELDKPWSESPFLFQGFLIEDAITLQKIKDQCEYVYVDIIKQSSSLPINITIEIISKYKKPTPKASFKKHKSWTKIKLARKTSTGPYKLKDIVDKKLDTDDITPPEKQRTFEEEINNAQKIHLKTSHIIKNFLHEVSNGRKINLDIAKKAVYDCMHSVLHTPDAMMLMTQLRHKDRYTWNHSINVCILALALGRHLNLRYDELITLGLCGMLHDIGKMRIPTKILTNLDNLSAEENKILQSHARLGNEILSSLPNMAKVVADVAYSHHERLDGSGFPRALIGKQISPYTRMISIVDRYDSITTNSIQQKSKTHLEAINILIEESEAQIDETLVNRFIQCIGVYPAGCAVEMNNGEIALVIEVNPKKKLRPKILLIQDKNKKKQTKKKVINLAETEFDANGEMYKIKTIVRQHDYKIDINSYYKYGVIQKELGI